MSNTFERTVSSLLSTLSSDLNSLSHPLSASGIISPFLDISLNELYPARKGQNACSYFILFFLFQKIFSDLFIFFKRWVEKRLKFNPLLFKKERVEGKEEKSHYLCPHAVKYTRGGGEISSCQFPTFVSKLVCLGEGSQGKGSGSEPIQPSCSCAPSTGLHFSCPRLSERKGTC